MRKEKEKEKKERKEEEKKILKKIGTFRFFVYITEHTPPPFVTFFFPHAQHIYVTPLILRRKKNERSVFSKKEGKPKL